jgi:hypothetical protein
MRKFLFPRQPRSLKAPSRAPKGLRVESLEGRLNLSTLFGLVNNYTVEIPTTGTYEVTLRNTTTRTGVRQIPVDSTAPSLPLWVQHASSFAGAAQGDKTIALSLTAGKHVLHVDAASGSVTDLLKAPVPSSLAVAQASMTQQQSADVLNLDGASSSSPTTRVRRSGSAMSSLAVVPTAPTNLLVNGVSSSQLTLTWNDNSTNETGFRIERSIAGSGRWIQIGTVGTNVKTYTDSGLSAASKYAYRVSATTATGTSGYSEIVSQATAAVVSVPGAPGSLAATPVGTTEISLAWSDAASTETGFEIERTIAGTDQWVRLTTVSANVTTYSDTGLSEGTGYDYRVRAVNIAGGSEFKQTTASTLVSPLNPQIPEIPEFPETPVTPQVPDTDPIIPPTDPTTPTDEITDPITDPVIPPRDPPCRRPAGTQLPRCHRYQRVRSDADVGGWGEQRDGL